MLKHLVERWRSRGEFENIRADPLRRPVIDLVQAVFDDPNDALSQLTDGNKRSLSDEILSDIEVKLSQANPVQAVRNALGSHVGDTAQFGVLLTTPEYSMFAGISGELRPRIPDLVKINKDLKEFFYGLSETPTTPNEMTEVLHVHAALRNLWMIAYNRIRIGIGDHHPDKKKDWFRPFLISQSIFIESSYRDELGLPSNVRRFEHDDSSSSSLARSLIHGTWPTIIAAGHKHPRLVWEASWESTFGEPSPFTGIEP